MAYGATGDGTTGYDDDDDGNDKEVDGDGTRRSFQGGTMKASLSRESQGRKEGRVIVVVAVVGIVGVDNGDAAFLLGGDDKGIVVEVVVRAAKKAG